MTRRITLALAAVVSAAFSVTAIAQDQPMVPNTPLPWAYALNSPGFGTPVVPEGPQRVPGSDVVFTFPQPRSLYDPPDWHPADHPPMPPVVARGRNPGVFACAYCHLPNGQGRPENASLAGLPADYIVQTLKDWKAGLRGSAEPQHGPTNNMKAVAANVSDEEIAEAAAYFASLKPVKWIRVVETGTVPETVVSGWMYIEKEGGGTEALGSRILEMPEDLERTELRDARSGFVAYVPPGSIERGRTLVAGVVNKTRPCGYCHGKDLRGQGAMPALAGRSPSYLARQLYDIQSGARKGTWTDLMVPVVQDLTTDDIVDITAYLGSLEP